MRFSKTLKICMIAFATSTLMACGGGGGDTSSSQISSTPTPTPINLTLSISSESVQMNEGTSESISFSATYSGDKELIYTVDVSGVEGVTVTQVGEDITITASEMSKLINNATIKLDVTDGSVSDSDSLSVSIINTSFFSTRDELIKEVDGLLSFIDNDMSAYSTIVFLTDVDVKIGLIEKDTLGPEVEMRGDAISAASSKISEELNSLITSLDYYTSQSQGSESELSTYAQQIQGFVDDYVKDIDLLYADVISTGGNILPKIRFTSLNKVGEKYSLFIGNALMGSNESGEWLFSEEYAFLESVINSKVCYTL